MRNDFGNRPKKAKGGRTGKQFGGGLSRPLARPLGGAGAGAGVGAPVRPLGFKHGKSVKKKAQEFFMPGIEIRGRSKIANYRDGGRIGLKKGSKRKMAAKRKGS